MCLSVPAGDIVPSWLWCGLIGMRHGAWGGTKKKKGVKPGGGVGGISKRGEVNLYVANT